MKGIEVTLAIMETKDSTVEYLTFMSIGEASRHATYKYAYAIVGNDSVEYKSKRKSKLIEAIKIQYRNQQNDAE